MGIKKMAWDAVKWTAIKKHLGYSSAELKLFKSNPRNKEVLEKASEMLETTIVVEVVESHGCNSHHRVGDKLYFDGAGSPIQPPSATATSDGAGHIVLDLATIPATVADAAIKIGSY